MKPQPRRAIERRRDPPMTTFERHAQTILAGLILAALVAASALLFDLRDRMAKTEILLEIVRASQSDRYTSQDARRMEQDIERKITTMDDRLRAVERRPRALDGR